MSSYRYSEGSSLFRKSVLHRIRFGNTLRLKADFPASAASSLRTNDFPGSDRRPSRSLSAYPDQWTHHHHRRRLSNITPLPIATASADDLSFHANMLKQQGFTNSTEALMIDLPMIPPISIISSSSIIFPATNTELDNNRNSPTTSQEQEQQSISHLPDCIYASNQSKTISSSRSDDSIRQRIKSKRKKSNLDSNKESPLTTKTNEIDNDSSSASASESTTINQASTPISSSGPACSCQLLWQLERETDSIDKFKLFFKRDHLNVDWDYVQGSSEV